jgi:hypothetical protein
VSLFRNRWGSAALQAAAGVSVGSQCQSNLRELEQAIYEWLAKWNHDPQPFVWKATADVILDK